MKTVLLFLAVLITAVVNAQTAWQIAGNSNTTTSNFLGTTNKQPVIFRTNNAERMRILPNGNMGIGTTKPVSKLDVAGTILGFDSYFGKTYPISVGTSGASYSSVGYGLTFSDTTGNYRYRISDFSSMINFNAGGFDFNTSPVGTAGNLIPYTTVMGILQNGQVGIGTNDPGDYQLQISHESSLLGLSIKNKASEDRWGFYTAGPLYLFFNEGLRGSFNSTTGAYTASSDERLKTNIKSMPAMLDKINQLKPSTYQFKNTNDKQDYNGFIAQDVMKIFPSLVMHNVVPERNLDVYTLDYSGFGVIAIKGIQELEVVIEKQQQQIEELKQMVFTLQQSSDCNTRQQPDISNHKTTITLTNASLEQNIPNPFNNTTTINYSLPQTYSSAKIIVTDKSRKVLKEATLSAKGNGSLKLDASTLASGAYNYSLYVDGKLIETKQMILSK